MDLQQTIEQLEQQAAKYTEAANRLRDLLSETGGQSGGAAASSPAAGSMSGSNATSSSKRRGRQTGSTNKPKGDRPKRFVSQETRDKIAAATKARHEAARIAREQAAGNSGNENNDAAQ